jgi:hypothetical protein
MTELKVRLVGKPYIKQLAMNGGSSGEGHNVP